MERRHEENTKRLRTDMQNMLADAESMLKKEIDHLRKTMNTSERRAGQLEQQLDYARKESTKSAQEVGDVKHTVARLEQMLAKLSREASELKLTQQGSTSLKLKLKRASVTEDQNQEREKEESWRRKSELSMGKVDKDVSFVSEDGDSPQSASNSTGLVGVSAPLSR